MFQARISESDWSDETAPFPAQPWKATNIIWCTLLAVIAKESIDALNNSSIPMTLIWIIYESYIIFDHVPFLFTNTLYDSPRFNYTYISPFFFWGLEAVASIVATQSDVGAPKWILYNVVPHCFFISAEHIIGAATSNAFSGEKNGYIFLQVMLDIAIHGISLWYHLVYLLYITEMTIFLLPQLLLLTLVSSMILLTYWVHARHMSWSHFFRSLPPVKRE